MALSQAAELIVNHAYAGMDTSKPDWSKSQQKDMLRFTKRWLPKLIQQGESPEYALDKVFAFYTPPEDATRGAWFMGRARDKAAELNIDLSDPEQFMTSLADAYDNQGMSLSNPRNNGSDPGPSKVGAWFRKHTPGTKQKLKQGFGPKQQ